MEKGDYFIDDSYCSFFILSFFLSFFFPPSFVVRSNDRSNAETKLFLGLRTSEMWIRNLISPPPPRSHSLSKVSDSSVSWNESKCNDRCVPLSNLFAERIRSRSKPPLHLPVPPSSSTTLSLASLSLSISFSTLSIDGRFSRAVKIGEKIGTGLYIYIYMLYWRERRIKKFCREAAKGVGSFFRGQPLNPAF